MKCQACDTILNDKEDGAKFTGSGQRVGLCAGCADWLPPDVSILGLDINSRLEREDEEDEEFIPFEDDEFDSIEEREDG